MSKVSCSNSSGTSRSSIRSSNSSKIYISHHQKQHPIHQPLRDSKQMFLNRELPPIPTSKREQPLPPPPPPPTSKRPQIWTIPSFNSFGAYANINTSDANYYTVNTYGTYRQKSYTSDDVYDSNHGAYATSTISTTGLENPAFYSDADLTNIIRKAVYMSSAEGNKSLNHHHHHHPLPVLPPFTVNQNQQTQRLRNEIIATAATLPSIHSSTRKRPLHRFWEMRINDTERDTQTKNRRTIFCLAILVLCLAIVVIGVSAFTYLIVSKNLNLGWDESVAEDNKFANTDSVRLENERDRGSKTILGEFTITNRVFSNALTSWSNQEFEILASEVIKSMDEIFLESPLARVYNTTQISGFSESDTKGVIAKCKITLNLVLLTAAQEVGLTFIHALERGHGRLPAGNLRVDIRTIKFTGDSHWDEKWLYYNFVNMNEKIEPTFELHNGFDLLDNSLSQNKSNRYKYVIFAATSAMSFRTKRNIGDQSTAAVSGDRITNNIYSARDRKDTFANGLILNTELVHRKHDRDNDIANDFANSNLTKTVLPSNVPKPSYKPSSNDVSLLDVLHANDSEAQSKLINKTITDSLTKILHSWDLNESMRSLFIALSGTTPPIIMTNPGTSGTDSPLVVKENDSAKLKAFWSNWSEWSACRGVNTKCDPGRIHSRIRKCIAENGEVVNSDICRMNNGEQQELEIRDCRCDDESAHKMNFGFDNNNNNKYNVNMTTITDEVSHSSYNIEQRDRACNDCNQNEICLLQVKAAVPFCAKIKDPRDPRGCGGWCSGHKELCRYVGAQTYQCVDDSECLEGEWQCANGLCIPDSRRCDGHFNCFDMSDEMYCECKDDEFHCGNKTSCLPLSQKCDGIIHCWDGEDEQNCTKLCSENQFTCNTGGQCIPLEFFCDGRYKNCDDGSDEPDGCNASTCMTSERQCKNGRCVPKTLFCDGINNCGDNSDEIDCTKTFSTNRTKTIKKEASILTTAINNDPTAASATIQPLIRTKRLFNNTANAIKISDITSTMSSKININNKYSNRTTTRGNRVINLQRAKRQSNE